MENLVKNHIEVQGVVLTPDAIEELKKMQKNNNDSLHDLLERIAEATCFVGSIFHMFDKKEKNGEQAAEVMANLCMVREHLKNLKKP